MHRIEPLRQLSASAFWLVRDRGYVPSMTFG
jgi:hypothetical protein